MKIFNKPPEKPSEDFFQMTANDIIIKEDIYPHHEGQHSIFKEFGTRTGGFCDTWYRRKNWENLSELKKWKYIALCALYWEKQYKYWLEQEEYKKYLAYLKEQEKTEKLKPCPFCGEEKPCLMEKEDKYSHTEWYVYCPNCDCSTTKETWKDEAIEDWNMREG